MTDHRRLRLPLLALALAASAAPALAQSSPSPFTYATRYDAARPVVGTIAPDPDGTGPRSHSAVRNGSAA